MKRRSNRIKGEETYFDFALLLIVLLLLAFGLVMVFSTSSHSAAIEMGDSTYYFYKQLRMNLIGIFAMMLITMMPYRWIKLIPLWFCYAVGLALIFALLSSYGVTRNGATRWLKILGIQFQVADLVKLLVIFILAKYLELNVNKLTNWKEVAKFVGIMIPFPILIYYISENLSSAIIIVAIGFVMLFIVTKNYKWFVLITIAGVGFIGGYVLWIKNTASGVDSFRNARILAWLDPEGFEGIQAEQPLQSLYAIGSGGLFGKGLGQSMQKIKSLSESQNDMIFSIICEELGLFPALGIILLYIILIWRIMIIAMNARDLYGMLLVVGIMAHTAIQTLINIAVATNSIPNTGVSLPFISYGGTFAIIILSEMGIVMSVARGIKLKSSSMS